MRPLVAALGMLALMGCPSWDAEREQRCRDLDASTGVCAGLDAGPGGGAGDDGGSLGGGAGGGGGSLGGGTGGGGPVFVDGGIDLLPPFSSDRRVQTYGTSSARLPVFLWDVPRVPGLLVTVETQPGAFMVWRTGGFGFSGYAPHPWCSSAASEQATLLGNAFADSNVGVSVDDVDAGDLPATNQDYKLTYCAAALAAYQRADGGIAFLGVSEQSSNLILETTSCGGCQPEQTVDVPLANPRLGEAVTDSAQTTWISAAIGPGQNTVVVFPVPADGLAGPTHTLGISDAGVRVELATSGTSVHAAWLDGQTLTLVGLSSDGGADQVRAWTLGEPARLVDLVENQKTVVAVLEFSGNRNVLLIGETMYRVATGFRFRPNVAHLRNKLRLAGQCLFRDGGVRGDQDAGCYDSSNNPILEFDRMPDGGPW